MIREALSFDDVLIVPKHSSIQSRSDIDISTQICGFTLRVPIISANMSSVSSRELVVAISKFGGLGVMHRFSIPFFQEADAIWIRNQLTSDEPFGFSMGVKGDWVTIAGFMFKAGANICFLDVAHGHHQNVLTIVEQWGTHFPGKALVVGNIATKEAFSDILTMYKRGIIKNQCQYPLGVKIGVGGGSMCTTRIATGCGVPTLQSLLDINPYDLSSQIEIGDPVSFIADGGIKTSGDIMKSLVAGADAVMIGRLLAGTDEAPGELLNFGQGPQKVYRGSASYADKIARGEQGNHVEGASGFVPYRGSVVGVLKELEDGIRSGYSYIGAKSTMLISGTFIKISESGLRESHAHGLT